jgi:hypothetical protein
MNNVYTLPIQRRKRFLSRGEAIFQRSRIDADDTGDSFSIDFPQPIGYDHSKNHRVSLPVKVTASFSKVLRPTTASQIKRIPISIDLSGRAKQTTKGEHNYVHYLRTFCPGRTDSGNGHLRHAEKNGTPGAGYARRLSGWRRDKT